MTESRRPPRRAFAAVMLARLARSARVGSSRWLRLTHVLGERPAPNSRSGPTIAPRRSRDAPGVHLSRKPFSPLDEVHLIIARTRSVAGCPVSGHFIKARFRQKFSRLSVPPNRVMKFVESTSMMSPARCPFGGIQSRELNSVFPATVKGCGRASSMGWRANPLNPCLRRSLVVRQMRMKVQGRDVLEQTPMVNVPEGRQGRDLIRPPATAGRSPYVLCTGIRGLISERVYCQSAAGAEQAGHRDGDTPSGAVSSRRKADVVMGGEERGMCLRVEASLDRLDLF